MKAKSEHFEQLSAYLDGELSPVEAERLEKALSADAELAAELERLRRLRRLLRDLPRQRAGDDFVARVLEQAERTRLVSQPAATAPAPRLRWVRYLATAAVLIFVVGVGAVIVHLFSSPLQHAPTVAQAPPAARGPEGSAEVAAKADREAYVAKGNGRESKDLANGLRVGGKEGVADAKLGVVAGTVNEIDREKTDARYAKAGAAEPGRTYEYEDGWKGKGFLASNVATDYAGPGDALAGDNDAEVLFASATNEFIDTDNLAVARREVERVLDDNNIRVEPGSWQATAENFTPTQELTNRAQFNRDTPRQVQIVAFVPREQLPQVQRELGELRSRQHVAQRAEIGRYFSKTGREPAQAAPKPLAAPAKAATPPPAPAETQMAKALHAEAPSPAAEEAIASAPGQGRPAEAAERPPRSAGVEAPPAAPSTPAPAPAVALPTLAEQPELAPAAPAAQKAPEKSEAPTDVARTTQAEVEGEPRYVARGGEPPTRRAATANGQISQAATTQEAIAGQRERIAQQQASDTPWGREEQMRRQDTLKRQIHSQLAAYDVQPLLITLNYRAAPTGADVNGAMSLRDAAATQEAAPSAAPHTERSGQ